MSIAQTLANKALIAIRHAKRMAKQAAKTEKRTLNRVAATPRVVEKKEVVKGMQMITLPTSVRNAFENVQVKRVVNVEQAKHIAGAIMNSLATKAGIIKRPAVSLNVTTPTFKKMVAEGIVIMEKA